MNDVAPRVVKGALTGGRHDGAEVIRWGLGGPCLEGLTTVGVQRAAEATAAWLGGLEGADRAAFASAAGIAAVRIGSHLWDIPLVPGRELECAERMAAVVNEPGSIGRLPS